MRREGSTCVDDAALVAAIAAGDRDSLAALYDRHAPELFALSVRLVRHRGDAEDLVHDLFLEVWQQVACYDEARGSVRTWLLVRLRSRATDRLRMRTTRLRLLESDAHRCPRPTDPGIDATAAPDHARLRDAIVRLPKRQRRIVELVYFEGLCFREAAQRCGVPASTAKSRVAAAVAALQRELRVGANALYTGSRRA